MAQSKPDPGAWILAAADALNRHGSWTGRIHIHKHLFITQVLELANPPFEFTLHDYGPYSFELDEQIVDLEMFGHLDRSYPQAGYGPRYEPTPQGLAIAQGLAHPDTIAVNRVAEELRDRKSQDLELVATCLWVQRREKITDPAEVVKRVQRAKPKYDEKTIERSLKDADALVSRLTE